MALIPAVNEEIVNEFEYTEMPGLTYRMRVDREDGMEGQIIGYTDNLAAVEQAVYKILNTERGEYSELYGDEYGTETDDLFGMPIPYVVPELDRRIKEALLQDDRITSVDNFTFDIPKKGVLHVEFSVSTIYDEEAITIDYEMEVA